MYPKEEKWGALAKPNRQIISGPPLTRTNWDSVKSQGKKRKSRGCKWLHPRTRQPRHPSRLSWRQMNPLPALPQNVRGSQGPLLSALRWQVEGKPRRSCVPPAANVGETVETRPPGKWAKFKIFLEMWGTGEIQLQHVLFLLTVLSRSEI